MERIMSIVNNLLLKRDRDAEQRENLSVSIRSLRADALRQTSAQESLHNKHVEAQRKLGIAEATERALKLQLRSAEQAAKALKEEMLKMKMLVNQTRAQCANDVRKREKIIEGMKKHVGEGGRARGTGKMVGVVNVSVTAGIGAETNTMGSVSTTEPGYDLRMETNEFLTNLASGLSEENENMSALLRKTVETLKALSGCEKEDIQEGGMVVQMDGGYENLASEIDFVIEHVRNLLTNPSFVPLEEVEVREEEIIRLREGWEKMESKWREAVHMMDGWRKRMAKSGQTVNLEELKMGLRLSPLKGNEGPVDKIFQLSTLMEEGEDDTQADIEAMNEEENEELIEPDFDALDSDSDSSMFENDPVEEASGVVSAEARDDFSLTRASSSSPLPEAPQLSPLRETNNNIIRGPRDAFTTIIEENTYDLLQIQTPAQEEASKSVTKIRQPETQLSTSPSDDISLLKTSNPTKSSSPKKRLRPTPSQQVPATPRLKETASSRLPRPRDNAIPQQSPLTMASIAAKLAATEREADAARVRAKIKAARMKNASNVDAVKSMPPPPKAVGEDVEPTKGETEAANETETERGVRKRKAQGRQGGRVNRRRSTLSPWELESLISGGVAE
ncbi:Afadin and alpha-actinin-binding-domain-containing protein [Bisporella sp. PMI_857]|nr:Afadin and alpha-actinin-binding-domain-containing protein [Bisporella sp. PMI_857]